MIVRLLLLFCLCGLNAQSLFAPYQEISNTADNVRASIPYDVDNDGFVDVVGANFVSGEIEWYKNLDGEGNFSSANLISDSAIVVLGMKLADINNDGAIDIIYWTNLDFIYWLEHIDGQGTFSEERIISEIAPPLDISIDDLDGDGDMDVFALLFTNGFQNRLVWYENLDGSGNFGNETVIASISNYSNRVHLADLNNDGYSDILLSYESVNVGVALYWIRNDSGEGFFSEELIAEFEYLTSFFPRITGIGSADLNGDGHTDILVNTIFEELGWDDNLYWIENIGSTGVFGTANLIHGQDDFYVTRINAADLDNDGDLDVFLNSSWFENIDGQGSFGLKNIFVTESSSYSEAAYINEDDRLDIVTSSQLSDSVGWYENLGLLNSVEYPDQTIAIAPNPTADQIYIQTPIKILNIQLRDLSGRLLQEWQGSDQLSLELFAEGTYILTITDANQNVASFKIIRKD